MVALVPRVVGFFSGTNPQSNSESKKSARNLGKAKKDGSVKDIPGEMEAQTPQDQAEQLFIENDRLKEELRLREYESEAKLSLLHAQHENELNNIQEKHESDKTEWNMAMEQQKSWQEEADKRHRESVWHTEKKYQIAVEEKNRFHSSVVNSFQQTISDMERTKISDRESVERHIAKITHEHEIKEARLNSQISLLKKEHASEQKNMKTEMEEMKKHYDQQIQQNKSRLERNFAEKEMQLKRVHEEIANRMRVNVDGLNAALLKRDDFKPIPDDEMRAKFLDLAQDVNTLAQVEWRANQRVWSSQVLLRLSPNQKLFKIQILQDIIWVALYRFIFCSPFRMFGEEGQKLECQWNAKDVKGLCHNSHII